MPAFASLRDIARDVVRRVLERRGLHVRSGRGRGRRRRRAEPAQGRSRCRGRGRGQGQGRGRRPPHGARGDVAVRTAQAERDDTTDERATARVAPTRAFISSWPTIGRRLFLNKATSGHERHRVQQRSRRTRGCSRSDRVVGAEILGPDPARVPARVGHEQKAILAAERAARVSHLSLACTTRMLPADADGAWSWRLCSAETFAFCGMQMVSLARMALLLSRWAPLRPAPSRSPRRRPSPPSPPPSP